jgi:hypothetical protein
MTSQVVDPATRALGSAAIGARAAVRAAGRISRPALVLFVASACWLSSLVGVNLRSMNAVGLLSVMPVTFFASLALLTVGFMLTLDFYPERRKVLAGYLVALATVSHGTPAILYGTVRYSWSWKHLGIVDYIQRHGALDPDAKFLGIYHNWPGLFGLTAMASDVTGIDARTIAIWTPLVLTLLALLALWLIFQALVDDQRIVWLALWLFGVGNWVGQEYFSPQGFTFVLYLTLLAVAIPFERRVHERRAGSVVLQGIGPAPTDGRARVAVIVFLLLVIATIVASHQLTPLMVIITLTVVALFGASRTLWLAIAGAAMTIAWIGGPAMSYVRREAPGFLDGVGSPSDTASASLLDTERVSLGQVAVVIGDRFLVQAMIVLALVGIASRLLRRRSVGLLGALLCAPAVLAVTDYEGEVLFRVYLFAIPWLALAAAYAVSAVFDGQPAWFAYAARTTIAGVLLVGFLFAYLGKEAANYFTPEEVAVTTWLYDRAPPNTLLVEGSRNYPGSSRNYENFRYVAIGREPADSQARIEADPEAAMYRWMSDDRYAASYLLITRSQKLAEASVPSMPPGLLDELERAVRASPRFEVVRENSDAVVFALADGGR